MRIFQGVECVSYAAAGVCPVRRKQKTGAFVSVKAPVFFKFMQLGIDRTGMACYPVEAVQETG